MPDSESDQSASTAQFRAYSDHYEQAEAPWEMRASRNQVGKLAAIVIGVAVLLALLAFLFI
jgi:hypothetical protein